MSDPNLNPNEFFKDLQPKPLRIPPIDVATLTRADVSLPDSLIKGLLYRGTKMVIAGGSKSYKTWLLMHLGYCMAHAQAWLGFETLRSHVCYCNLELKSQIFNERLLTLQNAMRLHPVSESFYVLHFRDAIVQPDQLYLTLLQNVAFALYDVVIIDPVYKLLGDKDENSARDMTALMFELERIAAQNNVAVIFGHHYPKGAAANKDPLDRLAGSGVFGRDLDSILTLTPHEQEFCFTADFILRNHRPVDSVVCRWDYPLFHLDPQLDPAKLKKLGGRPQSFDSDQLLSLLAQYDDQLSITQFQALAAEQFLLSRRTFYRKLKSLRDSKAVFVSKLTGFLNLSAKNKSPLL
jgi:hypothetical protein